MRIAITGASGFTGAALLTSLRADGRSVLTVGRGASSDIQWDPRLGRLDPATLADVDAVVHLAGSPVGERWTEERKREIRESRVRSTRLLAQTVAGLSATARGPRVLVCASAIGFYGSRGDEWLDETSASGSDFLAGVVRDWETAADPARSASVRVVHVRAGVVLSPHGGALAKMLPPFRLGAGGRLGDGRQWMSWISLDDLVRTMRFALDTPGLVGPVNAVSPEPVTNTEFTAVLSRQLGRPAIARIPAFVLHALYGEMAEATLLASQRARPARLLQAGFAFAHAALEAALRFEFAR